LALFGLLDAALGMAWLQCKVVWWCTPDYSNGAALTSYSIRSPMLLMSSMRHCQLGSSRHIGCATANVAAAAQLAACFDVCKQI
jgi:hypothetical protein